MGVTQSIRVGTQWLLAGSVAQQVLTFAIGIMLARILIPEDFGLLVTIQIFTGVLSMVAGGGMGQALIRAKNIDEHDFHVVFTMQLLIGCLIYVFFFILSHWFSIWFNNPIYTDLLRVSAISFLLNPFLNIHVTWLNREMRYKERTIARFFVTILSSAISIIMALSGFGVWSLISGGLFGSILMIFILSRYTKVRPKIAFDVSKAKDFGTYGFKVSSNDIVSYIRKEVSNLIISKVMGAAMVGLYNKASSLGKMPFTIISTAVYQPVFREMAKSQDDLDKSRYLFFKMITLLLVYTLPFYIGISFVAEQFIVVVYGEKWIAAGEPLQILSLAGLFYCIGHPCGAVLAAYNRLGRELIVHSTTMILVIIATYIGLNWGLTGVSWGVLFCEIYSSVFMFFLAAQAIKTNVFELINKIKPAIALNCALVLVLFIPQLLYTSEQKILNPVSFLLLSICIGVFVYVGMFLFVPIKSLASESERWRKKIRLN